MTSINGTIPTCTCMWELIEAAELAVLCSVMAINVTFCSLSLCDAGGASL